MSSKRLRTTSKPKGLLFVISGPSGSGKTTLVKKLLKRQASEVSLIKSVSCTTRRPRQSEKDGKDYFFINKKEFAVRKYKGEFLEWTKYLDAYYATCKKFIKEQLQQNKNIILLVDIKGAFNIKRLFSHSTVLIFILPPSLEILEKRLEGRRSEEVRDFNKRLNIAKDEIKLAKRYDYTVVNTDLKTALEKLEDIVGRECQKEGCY